MWFLMSECFYYLPSFKLKTNKPGPKRKNMVPQKKVFKCEVNY